LHWTYNPTTSFFATHTSGCHRQPNGNTLVTNGPAGEVFEVTPTGSVVWNWATSSGGIFKVRKYPASLYRDKLLFAASIGGAINFDLAAGSAHAGRPYLLAGTLSGISPGVNIGNLNIPINPDIFTSFTRNQNSSHIFQDFRGTLDSLGNATATMITGPISTALVGRTMHFAFVLTGPLDFSSNASSVKIVL
jgi:hypothetical protein